MTPTQNVEDVLKLIANGASTADVVLMDKKVSITEAFQFIPILMSVPGVLPKLKPALEELKTADDAAKAKIVKYAQDNFELSNENTEGIIEDLTGMLTHGARLVGRFSKN